jgi:hypothetical protein
MATATTSTAVITRFEPNLLVEPRLNYAKFISAVWQEAARTSNIQSGNNYGLLNFIATDEEWNALPGNRIVDQEGLIHFVARYNIAADIPVPLLTVSQNAYKQYMKQDQYHQKIKEDLAEFTKKIAASIPAVDIAALRDPVFGCIFVSANNTFNGSARTKS